MPRQSSIFRGRQLDVCAARRGLCRDENFIGRTFKALHLRKCLRSSQRICLETVCQEHSHPCSTFRRCQLAHIKRILSVRWADDWMCVYSYPQMTQPEMHRLCVYIWTGLVLGRRVVCQVWAHESDSRYTRGLIPACSLAWLLWHKVPYLLHFILTLWSSFTPSDCYFTSSWSKELESTCPGLVTHEGESINRYRFSSCFFKDLIQNSAPSWHLSGLSRVSTFRLTFITLSYINQRSIWHAFNPHGKARLGVCGRQPHPKFAFERDTSPQCHSGSSAAFTYWKWSGADYMLVLENHCR